MVHELLIQLQTKKISFFPGGGEFIWELGLHICFCDFFKNKVNEYCIELYFIGFIGNFKMLKLKYKIKCIKY